MSGMHTAFDLSFAHTEGRWARQGSWVGATYPDVRIYQEIARTAERAGVDLLFFGDGSGIPDTWRGSMDAAVEWGIQWPRHDMSPVVTSMAAVTEHIGFGLTYSSTFLHPFTVARLLNSIDHVTNGRLAFNVVASARGGGCGELRLRGAHGPRRTLRPHERVHGRVPGALAIGARRGHPRRP
ncbi:LLM class flavin-dependent oxidoreductase [Herbiconiux liukaitaii]|uniref:LLM class flavin-dependent oxidoreductase n=1 Tax=Herbiconiux liukaitaii TaxID=3342799 RepID=UPI0035B95242